MDTSPSIRRALVGGLLALAAPLALAGYYQ